MTRITHRRVYQWQPTGKRSKVKPWKTWMDSSEEDPKKSRCIEVLMGEQQEDEAH